MSIRQIKWGYPLLFQGVLRRLLLIDYAKDGRASIEIAFNGALALSVLPSKMMTGAQRFQFPQETIMKLPLISMSVVAYAAVATAIICYAEL
jgi:hypothetical protein